MFAASAPPATLAGAEYPHPILAAVNNFFRIKDRGSTFYREFYGGMTTFFAMCV